MWLGMLPFSWRGLLPLLFVGACSFPDYSFVPDPLVSTCDDGRKGPNETGVDCGGVCKACNDAPELPVCNDAAQGANETDVDCGGVCPPCVAYRDCKTSEDCESGRCLAEVCAESTCTDRVKNATETDVDCGGDCPERCADTLRCNSEADCLSGVCAKQVCVAALCNDGVTNGNESGIDCGGSSCDPCLLGMACHQPADCATNNCDLQQLRCVPAECQNSTQNGVETDVDCGGTECAPCAPTKRCLLARDCASSVCDALTARCAEPSCTDKVSNQNESDVDCGGSCKGCAVAAKCRESSDCQSGVCQSKTCVPNSGTDMALDQTNWVATASNTFGSSSPSFMLDGNPSARWTSGEQQAAKMWVQVDMAKPQIFFKLTLDSSEWPADSGKGYNVYWSLDGTFNDTQKKAFSAGKPRQVLAFDAAVVARFVRIELTVPGTEWWSIGELFITQ